MLFIFEKTWQGPRNIDLRVESFLKMFETKLHEMSNEEFKVRYLAVFHAELNLPWLLMWPPWISHFCIGFKNLD